MVNEVNKIIYNTLLSERAIHLPGVGTLSVVRKSAEMASSDLILPPSYTIEFSSHTTATSIIDAISLEGKVDMLRSEDIYSRWLERVRTDSTLVIDGVGRLNNKSFVADPTFIALFNNSNGRPVKVKRKRGKGLLIVVILLILVMLVGGVVGGAYWFFNDDIKALINKTTEQKEETRNTPVEVEVEDTPTVIEYTDNGVVTTEETLDVIVEESPKPEKVVDTHIYSDAISADWRTQEDIRHKVVAGSYSTMENAETAVKTLMAEHENLYCEIFPLGWMYAVAIYGSADRDDCVEYMRKHRNNFTQIWIFTPREYR